ncbi:MAG: tetratricopeptide repeat protein, partial [Magnetovibrio sp.]|nr:tetratricopeptide repeat protein [Magnetovibrio sp.]
AYGESLEMERVGDPVKALKLAQKAVSLDSAFSAAALRLTELYLARGNSRKAQGVVEKAWSLMPHPDLVALYYQAHKATDGLKKMTAAQKLLSFKPSSPDSNVVVAEAALEAQLWGQARDHLGVALEAGHMTRKVLSLMAQLEDQDRGDKDQVRHWLMRAAQAPADPAWVCSGCGHVEPQWLAHCPKCRGFDTLKWDTPQGLTVHSSPDLNTQLLTHSPSSEVTEPA